VNVATAAVAQVEDRDSTSTRLALLNAAIDLLVDRGFGALTTTRLAEHAGFTRGALQHHFASRDDLLVQLFKFALSAELPRIPSDAASLPLDERVEILIAFLEEHTASKWQAASIALIKGIDRRSPVGIAIKETTYDRISCIHAKVKDLFPDISISSSEWATLIRNLSGEIYGSSLYIGWTPNDVIDIDTISSKSLRRKIAKFYFSTLLK
jgi:AcrR family transcriptional regulator